MPSGPDEWFQEAQALEKSGNAAAAVAGLRRVLAAEPKHARAWAHLGGNLYDQGLYEESLSATQRALQLDGSLDFARFNLGCVWMSLGRLREAEEVLRGTLSGTGGAQGGIRLALAECHIRQGHLEEARQHLDLVLQAEPANLMAFKNLLHIHRLREDPRGLAEALEARLKVVPGCVEARMELALLHLQTGDWLRGWEEYEVRFQESSQKVILPGTFETPHWDGSPFPGKTLLLCREQGLGDTLMFIRYASVAKALGGRVVALVQPELADLIATCPGVDEVVPENKPLPPHDVHLPLMSLPRVFRTGVDTAPCEIPYLGVPERVPNREALARVLAASEGCLRIGYVWAGRPTHLNDRIRSIPPECLSPLQALPGVVWHCLQLPVPDQCPLPSVPVGKLLSNFSDTAYVLSGMDLVITVDTALTHLAGALGIPTFLLLPVASDWRWLADRTDSPWYPTLRIYRQPRPGAWEEVVGDVLRDLMAGS